jgi:hypothetical protein
MPYLFSAALLATSSVLGAKVRSHRRVQRERTKAYWDARDAAIQRGRR